MDEATRAVAEFLAAAAECERDLSDALLWLDLGETGRVVPRVEVAEFGDAVWLHVGAVRAGDAVAAPGRDNELEVRVSVEVTDPGFRVHTWAGARLLDPVGGFAAGTHDLLAETSPLLDLGAALATMRAQVTAVARAPLPGRAR